MHVNTKYPMHIHNRSNSADEYVLTPFDRESVQNSNFDFEKPTFLQFHGYDDQARGTWVEEAKDGKYNMLVNKKIKIIKGRIKMVNKIIKMVNSI